MREPAPTMIGKTKTFFLKSHLSSVPPCTIIWINKRAKKERDDIYLR